MVAARCKDSACFDGRERLELNLLQIPLNGLWISFQVAGVHLSVTHQERKAVTGLLVSLQSESGDISNRKADTKENIFHLPLLKSPGLLCCPGGLLKNLTLFFDVVWIICQVQGQGRGTGYHQDLLLRHRIVFFLFSWIKHWSGTWDIWLQPCAHP